MSKRIIFSFIVISLILLCAVSGAEEKKYQYVGSKACKECHHGKEAGHQYVKWMRSGHSHAYWRLFGEWAKYLASAREDYKDIQKPQEEQRCLKCHYTGAQEKDAVYGPQWTKEEGVGCEACHGPGSAYIDLEIMKDHEKFLANGGMVPGETTCKKCHRDDGFKYDEYWKKIAHPYPVKKPGEEVAKK